MNRLTAVCLPPALSVPVLSILGLALSLVPAAAQPASAPVAFVYVSNNPNNSNTNEVRAYSAAADGSLTPVVGSPFADDVTNLAVNGKYLFGSTRNGIYVATFTIEPSGAPRWSTSTDVVQHNIAECGTSGPLFLDHTGASLYDLEFNGNDCANNAYSSFTVNKASGHLQYLAAGPSDAWYSLPAVFTGNNQYAYTAVCLNNMYWQIAGFRRAANGALSQIDADAAVPAAAANDFWCPSQTAADPTNHVAISLQAVNENFLPDGPARLATYTAAANGSLSTASTLANMPTTAVGVISGLAMARDGRLLAAGGSAGLQIFHFNGGAPITQASGLVIRASIDQFFWDNANHLYAISRSTGRLYIFTVTSAGAARQAPGSPYAIQNPQYITVLPRTAATH